MSDNKRTSRKTTTWYVLPKDSHTNECIAEGAYPDATHEKVATVKGLQKPVKVIEVSHATLLVIERSMLHAHLNFDVFVQRGSGPLQKSPFRMGRLIVKGTHSASA